MAPEILTILTKIYWVYLLIIDYLTDIIYGYIYQSKHEPLPPIKNPVLLMSATAIAEKIRSKEIKSEYVVKAFIDRIKEVNITVNAMVDTRYEDAIREAQQVDILIASDEKTEEQLREETPFLGVPYTTKDCFEVNGLHQTGGLVSRKNCISTKDAPIVTIMRNAGAILLGVTNVPELCCWFETNNRVYGITKNPYDTTKHAGGSSGGEGSLISSAGSVFGIGTDIGGSIRVPSYCCGIFGHKPSIGSVPIDGMIPESVGALRNFNTVGPMCRYASDLMPMLKVLSKNTATNLKLNTPVNINKLKIYYMEDDGGNPNTSKVDPELKAAIQKVTVHFEKAHGIKAEKLNIRELYYSIQIYTTSFFGEPSVSWAKTFAGGKGEINGFQELIKWCLFNSDFTAHGLNMIITEKIMNKDPSFIQEAQAKLKTLRDTFQDILGDNAVFLYPPSPRLPGYHHQSAFTPCNIVYTGIFNILGYPVTQCPLGLSTKGVPLGVQVVANRFQDHLTLAVAQELEKAFGGWVPPCPIA